MQTMNLFKIGAIADSFRKGPREGVQAAKDVGAEGFQIYAVSGEISPEAMDAAARQAFRAYCDKLGLAIAALCGDLGGHGFMLEAENQDKIPRSQRIVDLAADLGTPVVTTHIGVVPEDPAAPVYRTLQTACRTLGAYAAGKGVTFAIETGPESAPVLRAFLDSLGVKGIGVNLDPANLAMVGGHDPVEAVRLLAPYIVHTHAKDGRRLKPCSAPEVYTAFADGTYGKLVERLGGDPFVEAPLGEGDVPWDAYLAALKAAGYRGFLTIEREVGADPAADIARAVRFLRERMVAGKL
jgi:sugar phosphate isomerase/epimerase